MSRTYNPNRGSNPNINPETGTLPVPPPDDHTVKDNTSDDD